MELDLIPTEIAFFIWFTIVGILEIGNEGSSIPEALMNCIAIFLS